MSIIQTRGNRRRRWLASGAICFTVIAALYGHYGYVSVCRQCGLLHRTHEWQIPFTRVTLVRNSSDLDTPVYQAMKRAGLAPKHDHQWSFIAGGGNGVTCAIGRGRYIYPSARSDAVARLIQAAGDFGEVQFRDKLVRALFDPDTSVEVWGLGLRAPTNSFTKASDLHEWIAEHIEMFDEGVAARRKKVEPVASGIGIQPSRSDSRPEPGAAGSRR